MEVALGQGSGGKWYVSTLELQVASFEVCVACRDVRTLRVTVDKRMPLSLWGDEVPRVHPPDAPKQRRLPSLQAFSVVWEMPTYMIMPIFMEAALLRGVALMQVTGVLWKTARAHASTLSSWKDLWLPGVRLVHSRGTYFEAIKKFLDLEDCVHDGYVVPRQPRVLWPPGVRQLSLGCTFKEEIDWVRLPSCLERLALGSDFNQTIASVAWPASLKKLTLGGLFNRPLADVVWLASLLELSFGNAFNQSITHVAWPDALLQLTFGDCFNQPISNVVWPASLLRLAFGDAFDQPISNVVWPATLLKLAFGVSFDQPIADVIWPPSLNRLVFGRYFDHPISKVSWPNSLQSLEFGDSFDQSVENVVWPASLKWLTLSDQFDQPITAIVMPPDFDRYIFKSTQFLPVEDLFSWPPGIDLFDHPDTSTGVVN